MDCEIVRSWNWKTPCGCQGAGRPKGRNKARLSVKIHSSDPQSPSTDQPVLPSGDQSAVEPPGPIPNPEVKRRSANGSETIGLVRVGRRQVYARLQAIGAGLFFARDVKMQWPAFLQKDGIK